MSRPWMKYYPRDWRADPRLRMCSLAARGLWADLMGYMHEAEPYGYLLIDGKKPDLGNIAALVGRPLAETRRALAELAEHGVYSLDENEVLYSRRMVRDAAKELKDRENGKIGGNPRLTEGVNPPLKAQSPDTRIQNPTSEEKKKRDLFGVGEKRENEGARPPRHGQRSSKYGTIFLMQATDEWAIYVSDFKIVRGAEPIPNRHGGFWFMANGEASRPAKQNFRKRVA
jgi:hypothetical protein